MLIKALFSRGGSPIHYNVDGINYVFEQQDDGEFVCDISFSAHVNYVLQTGNFCVYEPVVVVDDGPEIAEPVEDASAQADTVPTVDVIVRKGGRKK